MNVTRYKCSVLAVDDDPAILAILTAQLGSEFDVVTACSAEEARAVLALRSMDIVLSDLQLPDESGLQLLDWVHRTVPRTARVLLTGTASMQDAVDAINHTQVHRLVLKPWRSEDLIQALRTISCGLLMERSHEQLLHDQRKMNLELEQRVRARTLDLERAMLQLERDKAVLEREARTDPLTGLANRRAIDAIAKNELRRRDRTPAPFALVMIDADHFGQVNRDYSLTAGDQVLVWLAGIIQESVRASDSVGRVGGEEFLVVAPNTDWAGAEVLAERLRASVEASQTIYVEKTQTGEFKEHPIRLTISVGVAVVDAITPTDYDQVRATAAEAEREAKGTGRNKTVIRVLAAPPVV